MQRNALSYLGFLSSVLRGYAHDIHFFLFNTVFLVTLAFDFQNVLFASASFFTCSDLIFEVIRQINSFAFDKDLWL